MFDPGVAAGDRNTGHRDRAGYPSVLRDRYGGFHHGRRLAAPAADRGQPRVRPARGRDAARVRGAGWLEIVHRSSLAAADPHLRDETIDCALLDLGRPDTTGLDGLSRIQEAAAELPVIVLSGGQSDEIAVQAVHEGHRTTSLSGAHRRAGGALRALRDRAQDHPGQARPPGPGQRQVGQRLHPQAGLARPLHRRRQLDSTTSGWAWWPCRPIPERR